MYRFIWKIKLADNVTDEAFETHWHDSSVILQEYPGARGTFIHKARNEDRSYFLVAQWESQEARDAMQAENEKGESDRAKRYLEYAKNDSFGEMQALFAGTEIGSVHPITQ